MDSKGRGAKVVMVSGEVTLYVTCFCITLRIQPSVPNPQAKVKFSVLFSSVFYKMTLDDESDSFRDEVSLWRSFRDETFFFTIHAFLIILQESLLARSEGC